jgi:hypothetical protein
MFQVFRSAHCLNGSHKSSEVEMEPSNYGANVHYSIVKSANLPIQQMTLQNIRPNASNRYKN